MIGAIPAAGSVPGLDVLGVVGLAGAIGTGLIFLHAGTSKLVHRDVLRGVVANYRLLPAALVGPVSAILPFAELALGAALVAEGQRLAVLPGAALLLVFAGAMAVNILRGRRQIDCGCGRSQLRQVLGWPLVVRNLVLAALLLSRLWTASAPSVLDMVTAVGAGVSLFVVYLLFNAIVALAGSPLAVHVSMGRR